MPVIDHFRHSIRATPEQHLTREGVRLARRVGETLPEYDTVATSEIPRAIETAIAMGYGVDRYYSELFITANLDVGPEPWNFTTFAEANRRGGATTNAAKSQAGLLRAIAADLPEDGRALIVSHGGVIELGVVGLLPDIDYSKWGPACERCEGVRLTFEGSECVGAQIMRLTDLLPS